MDGLERFNTAKKCECGKATSVLARRVEARLIEPGFRSFAPFVGESGEVVGRERVFGDSSLVVIPCRGCGKSRVARQVLGVHRAHVACDARCTSARGHSCECSCGGKNHGADHG